MTENQFPANLHERVILINLPSSASIWPISDRLVNRICLCKAQSSRVSRLHGVVPEPRQMERPEDEDKMSGWKRRTEKKKFENTSSTWSNLIWRHKETSSTREIGEDVFFHEKTLVCLRQRLLLSSHRNSLSIRYTHSGRDCMTRSQHYLFDFSSYVKSLRVIEFRELRALMSAELVCTV